MEITETTINELLVLVKSDLQIDFNDDDERLKNLIKNGVSELTRVCGVVADDLMAGGKANALLLAYARRAYDGDLTAFRQDYQSEIMTLKTESEFNRYAKEENENL